MARLSGTSLHVNPAYLAGRPGKTRAGAVVVTVVTEGAVDAPVVDITVAEVVVADAAEDSRWGGKPDVKTATARNEGVGEVVVHSTKLNNIFYFAQSDSLHTLYA